MSTNATLADLIKDVQYELGHATSVSIGQQFRGHLTHRLQREYERLYRDFTWPHLRKWADVTLVAGTKTYTLPSIGGDPLTIADVRQVFIKWGGQWTPLTRGIEIDDYNAFDSDAGVRGDPAQKWAPASETTVEVWPVPASAGTVRLLALTPFRQMLIETDTCRLDDQLVSLSAAAEYLARAGSKDAGAVLTRAGQHYATLKQRVSQGQNKISLKGGQKPDPADPRNKVFVGVKSA